MAPAHTLPQNKQTYPSLGNSYKGVSFDLLTPQGQGKHERLTFCVSQDYG